MQPSSNPATVEQLLAQRDWLRTLARQIAGEGEAADLEQEVWLAALRSPPEARPALRPWIAGVVRNLARGLRRGRARRGEREQGSARPEALPSTLELVERVDTEQRVARALLALDEPERTTLLLRFHEGLSSAEIARRQGVPEGTVRWRAKRGIDQLRARLAREYGDREAFGLALAHVIGGSGAGATATAGAALMGGTKAVAAGVLALGAAFTAWWWIQRDGETRASLVSRTSEVRATLAAVSAEAEAGPSALMPADSSGAPGANQRSVAGPPITRLHVLESDGRPNAELNVVLAPFRGEHDELAQLTDKEGWVEFPASGEHRAMVVERLNAFPFRSELDLLPGESTLTLPEPVGADLAGRVLVDGEVPPRPLWLFLYAASSAHITIDTGDVGCLLAGDVTSAETDAQGRFRFRGLTPGRGLNLRVPEGFVPLGTGTRDLHEDPIEHFEGPAEGVLIELEALPRVHGRVLEADGSTPAAKVGIEIEMVGGTWGRDTQPDGTFEVFTREPPTHLSLRIGNGAYGRALHDATPDGTVREFEFPEPQRHTDLGDLVLAPSAGAFVVVRGSNGEPLAGAEVGVVPGRPTNVTEADGRTWMSGLAAGTELAVTQRGYHSAFVVLPDPVPATLPVVLLPTNDLTLEVRGAAGEPLARILLELSTAEWFTPREEPSSLAWRRDHRSGGGPGSWWCAWPLHRGFEGRRGSFWGGPPNRVNFTTDPNGRCSLGEIRTGVPIHLQVLDDAGTVLREEELAPLGTEESRVVQVRLARTPGELRGRVLNEDGEPIAQARIGLSLAGADESNSFGTDSEGRFRIRYVAAQGLRLTVTKRGFLPLVREPVGSSAEELELVLLHGAELRVHVAASDPRFIAGARVRARRSAEEPGSGEPWIQGDALADGLLEFVGLPFEAHEVELELPVGTLRDSWAPPARELWFQVPDEIGTVALRWQLTTPDPGVHGHDVRFEPVGGGPTCTCHLVTEPNGTLQLLRFAGDYDLVLTGWVPVGAGVGGEGVTGNLSGVPVELERRRITVVAGATTEVRIER